MFLSLLTSLQAYSDSSRMFLLQHKVSFGEQYLLELTGGHQPLPSTITHMEM